MRADYVIIRAFGDEPVKLWMVAVRGAAVDVMGMNESAPMPFHLERTFYDDGLFGDIRAAYEAGQVDRLAALWDDASLLAKR